MKILAVEENEVSAKLIAKLLERYGSVTVVPDSGSALKACRQAYEDLDYYGLLLLDAEAIGLSGIDALTRLRAYEAKNGITVSSRTKILVCSSSDDIKDVLKATRAGADGYLRKPVGEYALDQQLEQLNFRKIKKGPPAKDS